MEDAGSSPVTRSASAQTFSDVLTDGVHVVCPGNTAQLHRLAVKVGIGYHFYDPVKKHPHYDIPKRRRVAILEAMQGLGVRYVYSREIVQAFKIALDTLR